MEFFLKEKDQQRYQEELKKRKADHERLSADLNKKRVVLQKEEAAALGPAPPDYIQTKDQRALEIQQGVDKRIANTLEQHSQQTRAWQKTFLEQVTQQHDTKQQTTKPPENERIQRFKEKFARAADRRNEQSHGRRRDDRSR
jgi:hypothetical protein